MAIEDINKQLEQGLKQESLLPRGMYITGRVISKKRRKTVTVERELVKKIAKYSRWAKVRSKIAAHVPDNVDIKEGDFVEIGQTRKISKTKSWVVTRVIKRDEE
ncbi:MAG: 30S ribosomal protein S17 [Methanobacteriota archaeon]|nr:MAG: 30S ribosomal protein S17 [Euryarchaeota archaeon]